MNCKDIEGNGHGLIYLLFVRRDWKKMINLTEDMRFPGRYSNTGPPELWLTWPRCSECTDICMCVCIYVGLCMRIKILFPLFKVLLAKPQTMTSPWQLEAQPGVAGRFLQILTSRWPNLNPVNIRRKHTMKTITLDLGSHHSHTPNLLNKLCKRKANLPYRKSTNGFRK
jgi:hypothetical protein